jgi:hypothetical protein
MDMQTRTGDTVLVDSREMTGSSAANNKSESKRERRKRNHALPSRTVWNFRKINGS